MLTLRTVSRVVAPPIHTVYATSTRTIFSRMRLNKLERIASASPDNATLQTAYLRELNRRHPELTVRRFQSQRFAFDEAGVREYISALMKLGTFDRMSLPQIARYVNSTLPKRDDAMQVTPEVVQRIVTDRVHVVLTQPKPTRVAMWRAIRALGVAVVVCSGALGMLSDDHNPIRNTSVHKEFEASDTQKTFADVRGMDESKEELRDLVEFLKNPDKFSQIGGKLPKGYLLVGPPGTGKTLLAKAVAGEAGVPFLFASGSDFDEMFVGLGAKRIRTLFESAKEQAPCIVFLDEIDALGGKRSQFEQSYARMSLNQLLVEMDGFKQSDGVVVIGATNFPQLLDPALVRPGRFDQTITIDLPDVSGRVDILHYYTQQVPLAPDVDIERVARGCPGMSGAALENIVNTAVLKAAVEKRKLVTMDDFHEAQDKCWN
eukprot:c8612_g1_i3.p1 GENE.c8612_g1_i3~~c8612_g1_i3.p1  ORF type:complete len:440 (+),score=109.94 c8612_g1_i3:27-1322(+)